MAKITGSRDAWKVGDASPPKRALFDVVNHEKDLILHSTVNFILSPEFWAECELDVELKWKGPIEFPDTDGIPTDKGGVYCFLLQPTHGLVPDTSYLLYIGQAKKFRSRYYSYRSDYNNYNVERLPVTTMLHKWVGQLFYYYAVIKDLSLLDSVEICLTNALIPPISSEIKRMRGKAVRAYRLVQGFQLEELQNGS